MPPHDGPLLFLIGDAFDPILAHRGSTPTYAICQEL